MFIRNDIQFEWDENKNLLNISKHGVSFMQAKNIFWDEDDLMIWMKNIRCRKKDLPWSEWIEMLICLRLYLPQETMIRSLE